MFEQHCLTDKCRLAGDMLTAKSVQTSKAGDLTFNRDQLNSGILNMKSGLAKWPPVMVVWSNR